MRNPNRWRLAAPAFLISFPSMRDSVPVALFDTDALKPWSDQESWSELFAQPTRRARASQKIALAFRHAARTARILAPGSQKRKGPSQGPFLSWQRYVCRGPGPASSAHSQVVPEKATAICEKRRDR